MIKLCLAGAAGHVGRELTRAISGSQDLVLVSAVGRSHAGKSLKDIGGGPGADIRIHGSVAEALQAGPAEVFIDYTRP
ncbi:MAG TPA: 4-hydroxy-tetrahydrodipicolinate reductase, partial [Gammaproteobacteria bacterium]|nr:4-hydroxy-tetrahydrodipicolinate reductase [Gammaproteobacteria bacterium]